MLRLIESFSEEDLISTKLRRETARSQLSEFIKLRDPSWTPAVFHHLICNELHKVMRGTVRRLIVELPPRHGKSTIVSRNFPPFYLGHRPDKEVIAASYNQDLADMFGAEVRNIMREPLYEQLFNTRVSPSFARQNALKTTVGGAYTAVGVGSATTGRGANILIIDDPVKDRRDADSETMRDAVWEWYQNVARTRLMPGGAIVILLTRWHEDDLVGRILAKSDAQWKRIRLPALLGDEPLWPEQFSLEELQSVRQEVDARTWESLYQQNPTIEDGDFFQRENILYYDRLPSNLRVIASSDYATTPDGGDFTVHAVLGLDHHDNLYILDIWRDQTSSDVWVDRMIDMCRTYEPVRWGEESGPIINAVEPYLLKRLKAARIRVDRRRYPSTADKVARARSLQSRVSERTVYFKRGAPENDWIVPELLKFPAGTYDDGVDALSLGARLADDIGPPPPPRDGTDSTPRKRDPWAGI